VVLLFEDELDGSAGVHRLVKMARPEAHDGKLYGTYHEGRVVLDKSIGTTQRYFDHVASGLRRHSGHGGKKTENSGNSEEFREHD
jgi:hypothetical protein